MNLNCDILIFTARFGNGHLSAAYAIKELLNMENAGLKIEIVDFVDAFLSPFSRMIYGIDHLSSSAYPAIYNHVYHRKQDGDDVLTGRIIRSHIIDRMHRYTFPSPPRIIISTFPLSAYYVSLLKESYAMDIKAVTCITDFLVKPEWIHPATDLYLTANKNLKNTIINLGIPDNQVEATGIPVRKAFLLEAADNEILFKYNISNDHFVILLMGGGNGYLPETSAIYRWFNTMNKAKVLVFTANNIGLYDKLIKRNLGDNIHILNFTDDVAPLMKRADLLITKAGGITVSEAIAAQLPMILYKAELGQEMENCRFIIDNGLGMEANTEKELKDQTYQLTHNKSLYQEIKSNIIQYRQKIKPETIGQRILQLLNPQELGPDKR